MPHISEWQIHSHRSATTQRVEEYVKYESSNTIISDAFRCIRQPVRDRIPSPGRIIPPSSALCDSCPLPGYLTTATCSCPCPLPHDLSPVQSLLPPNHKFTTTPCRLLGPSINSPIQQSSCSHLHSASHPYKPREPGKFPRVLVSWWVRARGLRAVQRRWHGSERGLVSHVAGDKRKRRHMAPLPQEDST